MSREKTVTLAPMLPDESELVFRTNNPEIKQACIGHMRFDFGSGNEFWHTWWGGLEMLNDKAFKKNLQSMVDGLRKTVLNDLSAIARECAANEDARLGKTWDDQCFGFKTETTDYSYYLKLNPSLGNYCYLYCYDKALLEQAMAQDKQTPSITQTM